MEHAVRDWRLRKPGTHTREVRAEVLSADAMTRIQTLESQMGQLIAAYNQLLQEHRQVREALVTHTHETIRSVA